MYFRFLDHVDLKIYPFCFERRLGTKSLSVMTIPSFFVFSFLFSVIVVGFSLLLD